MSTSEQFITRVLGVVDACWPWVAEWPQYTAAVGSAKPHGHGDGARPDGAKVIAELLLLLCLKWNTVIVHPPSIQIVLDHFRHLAYLAGAPAGTLGLDSAWWNRSYEAGANERYVSTDQEWQRFAITAALALHDRPRATVLDLGCGTGRMVDFAQLYGAIRYIGVDFASSAIETARVRETSEAGRALEVQWVQADLQTWAPTEEVDVVLISEVLYYLSQKDELLDRVLAALRPGGVLVVSMWKDGRRWFQWNTIGRAARRRGASLDAAATVHARLLSWMIRRYALPLVEPGVREAGAPQSRYDECVPAHQSPEQP